MDTHEETDVKSPGIQRADGGILADDAAVVLADAAWLDEMQRLSPDWSTSAHLQVRRGLDALGSSWKPRKILRVGHDRGSCPVGPEEPRLLVQARGYNWKAIPGLDDGWVFCSAPLAFWRRSFSRLHRIRRIRLLPDVQDSVGATTLVWGKD